MAEQQATTPEVNSGQRNIMIAMDGSKHAIHAFEWYIKHVFKPTDNVIMAHCAEHMVPSSPVTMLSGNPEMIQTMIEDHEKKVLKVFHTIDELANKHNVKHTLERLHGSPGEAIVKAAQKENCNIIVTGSRGFGTLRRTIMGSVSDYIIHHAHMPVIVCKHEDEHHKLK